MPMAVVLPLGSRETIIPVQFQHRQESQQHHQTAGSSGGNTDQGEAENGRNLREIRYTCMLDRAAAMLWILSSQTS